MHKLILIYKIINFTFPLNFLFKSIYKKVCQLFYVSLNIYPITNAEAEDQCYKKQLQSYVE